MWSKGEVLREQIQNNKSNEHFQYVVHTHQKSETEMWSTGEVIFLLILSFVYDEYFKKILSTKQKRNQTFSGKARLETEEERKEKRWGGGGAWKGARLGRVSLESNWLHKTWNAKEDLDAVVLTFTSSTPLLCKPFSGKLSLSVWYNEVQDFLSKVTCITVLEVCHEHTHIYTMCNKDYDF